MSDFDVPGCGPKHLLWIPIGALVGFALSFIAGDQLTLALDLYYLLYVAGVLGFFAFYAARSRLTLRAWIAPRLAAEEGGWPRKVSAGAAAWLSILLVTTTYHLGYADFRSARFCSRTSEARLDRCRPSLPRTRWPHR